MEPKYKSLQKSDFSIALPYVVGSLVVSVGLIYAQRYFLTGAWFSDAAVVSGIMYVAIISAVKKARTFPRFGKSEDQ